MQCSPAPSDRHTNTVPVASQRVGRQPIGTAVDADAGSRAGPAVEILIARGEHVANPAATP
jgi:hypothetical protein